MHSWTFSILYFRLFLGFRAWFFSYLLFRLNDSDYHISMWYCTAMIRCYPKIKPQTGGTKSWSVKIKNSVEIKNRKEPTPDEGHLSVIAREAEHSDSVISRKLHLYNVTNSSPPKRLDIHKCMRGHDNVENLNRQLTLQLDQIHIQ